MSKKISDSTPVGIKERGDPREGVFKFKRNTKYKDLEKCRFVFLIFRFLTVSPWEGYLYICPFYISNFFMNVILDDFDVQSPKK